MNENDKIQAISVNLLRVSEWLYKDPRGNRPVCERYLEQSKQLARDISDPHSQKWLDKLQKIDMQATSDSPQHLAERCLTIGVILQGRRNGD